jgi:hypothetical protein
MSVLLHLYPRVWRDRYGEEIELILAERGTSPADRLDLLRGILPAWWISRRRSRQARCAATARGATDGRSRRRLLHWPVAAVLLAGGTGASSAIVVHQAVFAAASPQCPWFQRGRDAGPAPGERASCELLPGWNAIWNPFHGLAVVPSAGPDGAPRVLAPGQEVEVFSDASGPVYRDVVYLPKGTHVVFPSSAGAGVTVHRGDTVAIVAAVDGRLRSPLLAAHSPLLRPVAATVRRLCLQPGRGGDSVCSYLWTAVAPGTASVRLQLPSGETTSLTVRVTA